MRQESSNSESHIINVDVSDQKRSDSHQIASSSTIVYDDDSKKFLETLFSSFREGNLRSQFNHDEFVDKTFRDEIFRFILAVDAYMDQKKPLMTREEIFSYALEGPEGAKKLKKLRTDLFVKSCSGLYMVKDTDLEKRGHIGYITDIGQIFNYRFLPYWAEPDEEDYKYMLIPVQQDAKAVDEFRNSTKKILSKIKDFRIIKKEEILMRVSSSKCLLEGKKVPVWQGKSKHIQFAKQIGKCLRSLIPVCPQGTRDSIIVEAAALNTIQWIDAQTNELIKQLPNHIMLRDKDAVDRVLENFIKKQVIYFGEGDQFDDTLTFLCRDFKKEGLTKPRNLIKIMMEELYNVTGLEVYLYSDFFDNQEIFLDEKNSFIPLRGHGLGMANSLTTLYQLILFDMIRNRVEGEYLACHKALDFVCLNDDICIRLHSNDLITYWEIEKEVLDSLSILRSNDKSFYLKDYALIAERYFGSKDISLKESYQRREILSILACVNITQAKSRFASSVHSVDPEFVRCYYKEILSVWGYEFYPEEYKMPTIFGGWSDSYIQSVDLSLYNLEQQNLYSRCVYNAFRASTHNKTIVPRKGKERFTLFGDLFPNRKIDPKYEKHFSILSYGEMRTKFCRTSENRSLEIYAWESLKSRREKEFKKNLLPPDIENFCREVQEAYPQKDFFPMNCMIEDYTKISFAKADGEGNIYLSSSPLESAIGAWNPDYECDEIRETYSINFFDNYFSINETNTAARKQMREFIKGKDVVFLGEYNNFTPIFQDPSKEEAFQRSFINCNAIAAVSILINFSNRIPICKKQFFNPLWEEKEKVFGFMIPFLDQSLLRGLPRKAAKQIYKRYLEEIRDNPDPSDRHEIREIFKECFPKEYKCQILKESLIKAFKRGEVKESKRIKTQPKIFKEAEDLFPRITENKRRLEILAESIHLNPSFDVERMSEVSESYEEYDIPFNGYVSSEEIDHSLLLEDYEEFFEEEEG